MPGKDGIDESITAWVTARTRRAPTGGCRVTTAVRDDLGGLTRWTRDAVWPAPRADGLTALPVMELEAGE
jgi:hypothetical protein